jgi:hypothetical protein
MSSLCRSDAVFVDSSASGILARSITTAEAVLLCMLWMHMWLLCGGTLVSCHCACLFSGLDAELHGRPRLQKRKMKKRSLGVKWLLTKLHVRTATWQHPLGVERKSSKSIVMFAPELSAIASAASMQSKETRQCTE